MSPSNYLWCFNIISTSQWPNLEGRFTYIYVKNYDLDLDSYLLFQWIRILIYKFHTISTRFYYIYCGKTYYLYIKTILLKSLHDSWCRCMGLSCPWSGEEARLAGQPLVTIPTEDPHHNHSQLDPAGHGTLTVRSIFYISISSCVIHCQTFRINYREYYLCIDTWNIVL